MQNNYVIKGNGTSLASFSNYANQWYGDLKARYRTCLRRGLNPDDYIPKDLQKILDNYAKGLLEQNRDELTEILVRDRVNETLYQKELEIRSSKAYRLGLFILTPLKKIKQLFKL